MDGGCAAVAAWEDSRMPKQGSSPAAPAHRSCWSLGSAGPSRPVSASSGRGVRLLVYGFMPMGLLVPGRDQTANSIGRECGIELRRRSAWVVDSCGPCTMSAHGPRGACPRVGRRTIRAAGRAEG